MEGGFRRGQGEGLLRTSVYSEPAKLSAVLFSFPLIDIPTRVVTATRQLFRFTVNVSYLDLE